MPESIEPLNFVSHRARMSGKFDSSKDSDSTKFEQRPKISGQLSFAELSPLVKSKNGSKQKGGLRFHETPILQVIPVAISKNSSATNGT